MSEINQELFLCLNGEWSSFWDNFFFIVSGKLTWIPLYVAIIYFSWRKWGWKQTLYIILFIAASIIIADRIAGIFKTYTPHLRPTHTPELEGLVHTVNGYVGGLYGTVSAHAATCFSVATFTAAIFKKRWYSIAIFFWAILVAYSRIYLGVHYPLDILYGIITGISLGALAVYLYNRLPKRRI